MKFVIYKSEDGFRWRLLSKNGRIIADGAESYKRRAAAEKSVKRICVDILDYNYQIKHEK